MRITDESERWVAEGIITDEQRDKIIDLYSKKHSNNSILVMFAIIGSLLLGLGTILIFASNWANIPRGVKAFIAFLPLLAAMGTAIFTLQKKSDSEAFREGSSLGLCLSVFATIALIGQVFQSTSSVAEYLGLCMMLSLPGLYIFRTKSPAVIYIMCMFFAGLSHDVPNLFSLFSVALFIPYIILEIRKADSKSALWYFTLLSDAALIFSLIKTSGILADYFDNYLIWIYSLILLPMLLILADTFIKRIKPFSAMPFCFLSGLAIAAIQLISGFREVGYRAWEGKGYPLFIACGVIVFAGYAFIRYFKNKKFTIDSVNAADAVMITAFLGLPLFWLWSNLLLLALSVFFIVLGSRTLSLKTVNCGMIVLCGLIFGRFTDTDLGLFARGIVFIIIGAAFILTNVLLFKKWRAK